MSLNFGILGKVLVSPKSAFESIANQTTMKDGVMMYVILGVLGAIITMGLGLAMMGGIVTAGGMPLDISGWAIMTAIQLVIGAVALVVIGVVAAKLAAAIGKGQDSTDKTVGFLGYAAIVDFVLSIVITLVLVIMVGAAMSSPQNAGGALLGALGMIGIIAIVGFIWLLYVGGSAVSVANGVGLGAGIVSYLIAAIVVGIVVGIISAAVLVAAGVTTVASTGASGGMGF